MLATRIDCIIGSEPAEQSLIIPSRVSKPGHPVFSCHGIEDAAGKFG
jgi:hypothetical protein